MNPVLRYSASSNLFGLFSSASLQREARRIGFEWDDRGFFKSPSPYRAIQFAQYADLAARRALRPYLQAVKESQATDSILEVPAPAGLEYMPLQKAGIAYASRGSNTVLGDEPGPCKTRASTCCLTANRKSRATDRRSFLTTWPSGCAPTL